VLLATAADPKRQWLASTERIACLDEQESARGDPITDVLSRCGGGRDSGKSSGSIMKKHDAVVRIYRHRAV
jgi:hypothetical protein